VRYYVTTPISGGTRFKRTFCKHRVTTVDFNSTNGKRRTQAAAMINQHAASLHLRTVPTKLGDHGNAVALCSPLTVRRVSSRLAGKWRARTGHAALITLASFWDIYPAQRVVHAGPPMIKNRKAGSLD